MTGQIVSGRVVGAERAQFHLGGAPDRVMAAVRKTVRQLGLELEKIVKTQKLTGVVLHRQSGDLARSVNTEMISTTTSETARTGTNKSYGRFWELGFHGIEFVRPHVRHIRSRDSYGRVAKLTKSGRMTTRRGARTGMGVGFVSGHSRHVDQPARPFLRSALEDIRPRVAPAILESAQIAAAAS